MATATQTRTDTVALPEFIARCAVAVRTTGSYVTKSQAWESGASATSTWAWDSAFDRPWTQSLLVTGAFGTPPTTEEDRTLAAKALLWAVGEFKGKDDDFATKVLDVLSAKIVTERDAGVAAYILGGYLKAEAAKAREAKTGNSEHVGTVGKREVFEVEVLSELLREGQFGMICLYTFVTPDGNVLKWFASSVQSFEIGQTYTVKATIKKHEEFRGVKETLVNRVAVQ